MNEKDKRRLELLKDKLQQQLHQEEMQKARQRFLDEIPNFDLEFEFVDGGEHKKIDAFVDKFPYVSPSQLDLSCFGKTTHYAELSLFPNQDEDYFIVCLSGSWETINIYTKGKAENITKRCDDWYSISPYLLLISLDYKKIVFINDYGEVTYAEMENLQSYAK